MKKLAAAIAGLLLVAGIGMAAPADAAPTDYVSATYTRDICFWLVPPGGYDTWYIYSYRTVHLFGGPVHVTQCAYGRLGASQPIGYYNLPNCRQYVWNGNFQPYWESYLPNYNNGPPYCW